jgi:Ser/Thr protein kinase RdoA (MazF antagonist)
LREEPAIADSAAVSSRDPAIALAAYADLESAAIEPLAGGLIHDSFAVRAASGRYVLQNVRPIFDPGIHENIRAVTAHLERKGLLTSRLVPARDGRPLADLGAHGMWRLWTWIEGATYERCTSERQAASAGALLARFHGALADLDHDFCPLGITLHDTPAHLARLAAALRASTSHRLLRDVAALAERIRSASEALPRLDTVRRRIAHGDPKFNNIRFAGSEAPAHDRAIALLDLDTVSALPLWTDIGDAWRSWCNRRSEDDPEPELDVVRLESALTAYLSALPVELDAGERESLAYGLEWISLELAARFATDALEECYFGWDATRFPAAGEHNLARARAQIGLHVQARDAREAQLRLLRG